MAKTWRCYNLDCRTALGQVVKGELVLRNGDSNIGSICTENASLVVQCRRCGRTNVWMPHDSKLVKTLIGTHLVQGFITSIKDAWQRAQAEPSDEELEEVI
jgi:hypothetical protein